MNPYWICVCFTLSLLHLRVMKAPVLGQDSCCFSRTPPLPLPVDNQRAFLRLSRFFGEKKEQGSSFGGKARENGGCGFEEGRGRGSAPAPLKLSASPRLWDGGCVWGYLWQHCCMPGTYHGNMAKESWFLCVCVSVCVVQIHYGPHILVTLIFTQSDRKLLQPQSVCC